MGVRDHYDYTPAILHHSLWTRWLQKNGMKTDKRDESTRDLICIDFGFGLRSYAEEVAHIKQLKKAAADDAAKMEILNKVEEQIHANKDLYKKVTTPEIRRMFYEDGVPITYKKYNKDGEVISTEEVRYKMLYRNASKAKIGQAMFVREELYEKAYDWLTMGLGKRLPDHNAKIVEISAYAPLTTSSIEGVVQIPVENVLILKDQDSFFHTLADVVQATDYDVYVEEVNPETGKKEPVLTKKKKCTVERKEVDIKNTLWDGMALIESSVLPDWCNGMALLRNHFFKACAFKAKIQQFFRDYCAERGIDYETFEIEDMYGVKHRASSIQMITTDNATKWKKFVDLMGGTLRSGYEYWCGKVREDDCVWGIVKTDHVSKLGDVQQMSYQMVNSLPCTEEDVFEICQTSIKYVELLKRDNDEFEKFLRKNATAVNHYEMLADLYDWNHNFQNSVMFRNDKNKIISSYVMRLRKGKITIPGDNLTVCGNPYALLLYTVGEDWSADPTLRPEPGVIQVYAPKFADGEYLCGIRNPHNASNNMGYFRNVKHPLMEKYFDFSNNIMAVNCIETDIQDRMNGMDSSKQGRFWGNSVQKLCGELREG